MNRICYFLSFALLVLAGCSKMDNGLRISRYREDEASRYARGMPIEKLPSFSGIFVFATDTSRGMDSEIFHDVVHKYPWIFSSTESKDIDAFIELLQKGEGDYSIKDFDGPGRTFHVLLPIKGSSEAYFFRIFVPDGVEKAKLRASPRSNRDFSTQEIFNWTRRFGVRQ